MCVCFILNPSTDLLDIMFLHQHKRGENRRKLWQRDEKEKLVERWWKSLKQGVLPWKCSIKQYQVRPDLDIGDFCGALQLNLERLQLESSSLHNCELLWQSTELRNAALARADGLTVFSLTNRSSARHSRGQESVMN